VGRHGGNTITSQVYFSKQLSSLAKKKHRINAIYNKLSG
jgi:hypothetical protein